MFRAASQSNQELVTRAAGDLRSCTAIWQPRRTVALELDPVSEAT